MAGNKSLEICNIELEDLTKTQRNQQQRRFLIKYDVTGCHWTRHLESIALLECRPFLFVEQKAP